MKPAFLYLRHLRLAWTLIFPALLSACSSSNPTNPDTRPPLVGWALPDTTGVGDRVFVFDVDTTTIQLNAGDDGGIISNVKVYMDGALVVTLTSAPYRTLLSLSGIRGNRSARLWATAADPTGKVGSTADTLTFVHIALPDTARWTLLSPSRSPSGREGFSWELDPGSGRALLFGGLSSATFTTTNDLWSFDLVGNQWDSLTPSGVPPLSRTLHGAGVAGSVMVIYGGRTQEIADSALEEYSLLDLGTLTWNSALFNFALHPVMAMSSATVGPDVYFYGGVGSTADFENVHDSLMRYSTQNDTWQSVSAGGSDPGNRALALVAADEEDNQIFLYGGTATTVSPSLGAPAGLGNFRLNLGNLTWASTQPAGPPGLVYGAAVCDSANHRILIWGGRDATGGLPVEVWEFTLGYNVWNQVPTVGTAPSGRTGHRLIYDAARNRLLLFGGHTAGGWSNETWELAW